MSVVEYASNAKGNLGVTLGGIGTGLSLMGGVLQNILGGGNNGCGDNAYVTRYDLSMMRDLVSKDMEIAYLKGRDAAKSDSIELYRYVDTKNAVFERELADQRVYNAANTSAISCIQGQIAQLMGLTKTVVPITSVCPRPMPEFNSWTAPNASASVSA